MDAADWDRRYAAAELVWSAGPNALVAQQVAGLRPGRALDLASGEGRNAIWLAQQGWTVMAVDFSPVASARAAELAGERLGRHVERFTAVCADLLDWRAAPAEFDLVILAYLQLPDVERRQVHRTAAAALAPGGTLLVVAHHLDNLLEGVGGPQDPAVLFTETEVLADLDGLDLDGGGLVVDRAERVEREVADAERPALDVLVRAHRPEEGRRRG